LENLKKNFKNVSNNWEEKLISEVEKKHWKFWKRKMLGKNFLKKLKFISLKFDYLKIQKRLSIKNDKRKQKQMFIKKFVCSKLFVKFVF
jgi:hypothetical protein